MMLGGFQDAEAGFVTNNSDATLFNCHGELNVD
jgi:hypothetical protein